MGFEFREIYKTREYGQMIYLEAKLQGQFGEFWEYARATRYGVIILSFSPSK